MWGRLCAICFTKLILILVTITWAQSMSWMLVEMLCTYKHLDLLTKWPKEILQAGLLKKQEIASTNLKFTMDNMQMVTDN